MGNGTAVVVAVAAMAAGLGLGLSLRSNSDGNILSGAGSGTSSKLSAIATGSNAESPDDEPDPFRTTAPTPERALKIWQSPRSRERALEFELAVMQMDAAQLAQTWSQLKNEVDFSDWQQMQILAPLFQQWGIRDVEGALAAAAGAKSSKNWAISEALSGLAREDSGAALALAKQQKTTDIVNTATAGILAEISKTDPAKAAGLIGALVADGSIGPGDWSLGGVFERWAREDPLAAVEGALELQDGIANPRLLTEAMAIWGRAAPEKALAWLGEHKDLPNGNNVFASVVAGWAVTAPQAAADYLLTTGDRERWDSTLEGVISQWSEQDFSAAAKWIGSVEDKTFREEAELELVENSPWTGNTEEMLAYGLDRMDDNPKMAEAIHQAIWRIAHEDPERAYRWIEGNFAESGQREEMLVGVISRSAYANPSLAAEKLELLPEGQARDDLFQSTGRGWARTDLDSARTWANALPEGDERDRAVVGVTQQWLDIDLPAAGEWVQSLDPGPVKDQLSYHQAVAFGWNEKQPERGLEISKAIADPHLRAETVEEIYEDWLGDTSEAAAARAALAADPSINEAMRWRLLNPP